MPCRTVLCLLPPHLNFAVPTKDRTNNPRPSARQWLANLAYPLRSKQGRTADLRRSSKEGLGGVGLFKSNPCTRCSVAPADKAAGWLGSSDG